MRLSEIKKTLQENLNYNVDVTFREFKKKNKKLMIVYIQDCIDSTLLSISVINPILSTKKELSIDSLIKDIIFVAGAEKLKRIDEVIKEILQGNAVLFIDGANEFLKLAVANIEKRSIVEPPTSAVIYGPREGFVESIKINTSLIRKRLPTTSLKMIEMNLGRYTKTKVRIFYLNDIADKKVVDRIEKQLQKIDIDGVIDSHYLVSFLEEQKNSIFKQVGKTEKPDVLVSKMLEGRVGIMVDGSPIALTLPFILLEDIQNSDDYYQKSFRISFIRMIRLFGIIFSIILPGAYVAVQTMHYRVIPIRFLITLMDSIQGLPFTPLLEMLFVVMLFEILYESSLRMPKYLGMALGIVGALILGDTAVKAGLISPPSVMLVALSGISFYTIPDEAAQLSLLRVMFIIAGGLFGMLGIALSLLFLLSYLNDLNAFGSPYLAPFAPSIKEDLKDGIFKRESLAIKTRPRSIPNQKIEKLSKSEDAK